MAIYERKETWDEQAVEELKKSYHAILTRIGEDPNREGLLKTPERAAKAMAVLTSGNGMDPEAILRSAMFTEPSDEMVLVRDIEVYSPASIICCRFLARHTLLISPTEKL